MGYFTFRTTMHPESSLMIQARVCKDRRSYLRYLRTKTVDDEPVSGADSVATCINWKTEGEHNVPSDWLLSELVFYRECMIVSTVAHEVVHAVTRFLWLTQYRELLKSKPTEETMAIMVGILTGRIWNWYEANKDAKPGHFIWKGGEENYAIPKWEDAAEVKENCTNVQSGELKGRQSDGQVEGLERRQSQGHGGGQEVAT